MGGGGAGAAGIDEGGGGGGTGQEPGGGGGAGGIAPGTPATASLLASSASWRSVKSISQMTSGLEQRFDVRSLLFSFFHLYQTNELSKQCLEIAKESMQGYHS